MRKKIAAIALGAGLAAAVLPLNAASASCWYIGEEFGCVGPPCLAEVYWTADAKLGDALPDQDGWACLE